MIKVDEVKIIDNDYSVEDFGEISTDPFVNQKTIQFAFSEQFSHGADELFCCRYSPPQYWNRRLQVRIISPFHFSGLKHPGCLRPSQKLRQ